jgi:hypothetical protein
VLDEGLRHLQPTLRRKVCLALRQETPIVLDVIREGAVRSDAVVDIIVIEDGMIIEYGNPQRAH